MASPYSPAPGQVMHYPQPHETHTTLPPPIQTQPQDFQQDYQQDFPQQLPQPPLPQQQQQPFQQPLQPPLQQPIQQPFPYPSQFDPQQQQQQQQQIPPQFPPSVLPLPTPFYPSPPPPPYQYQPPLWTPFHMQSLIPPDTPAKEIIPPSDLAIIVPLRTDTHVDRDLALLLTKAHKYGGTVPGGHHSRHKYEKYTFLAGLLLAKRGLPAVAVPDDPDDAYVRLLQVYLSNTSRLGSDPDAILMKTLIKGGGYYEKEDIVRERSRSRRSASTKSAKSGKSARSASRRRSERKSSSRQCSTSSESDWDD